MSAKMFVLILSFFILLFQGSNHCSAFKADSFIVKPDKEVYGCEGSDVTLEWQFHVGSWRSGSPIKIREFLFGEWMPPGYIRNKILVVQKQNVVLKRSGFETKVYWSGNILGCVNCTAKVKMYNLTAADFKTYGVEVELSMDRHLLKDWLKLKKFVPAEIILSKGRNIEEGSATTIECKATGLPPPSVIIKRKNQNLCENTGHCVYDIPAANKSVHEGEYLCLVQQRSYPNQTRRSSYLTVLEGRKIPPTKNIPDVQTTYTLTSIIIIIVVAVAVDIVIVGAVCLVFKLRRKHQLNSGSKQVQQGRVTGTSTEKEDTVQALMHHI